MSNRHLITGAAGFLGGSLAHHIISTTEDEVVLVSRHSKDATADERLRTMLNNAWAGYGGDVSQIPWERITLLEGDVTRRGVLSGDPGSITHLWHSAANLRYKQQHLDQLMETNVVGVRNVLDLASDLDTERFVHVSTAYVAGSRSGVILESDSTDEANANNAYELTKIRGEREVAWHDGDWVITRPSIVVGHSCTNYAFNHSGFYGMMRGLYTAARGAEKAGLDVEESGVLTVVGNAEQDVNLIPVDEAIAAIYAAGINGESGKTHHITNDAHITLENALVLGAKGLGLPTPKVVRTPEELPPPSRLLYRHMRFLASYLDHSKTFDSSNTQKALGRSVEYDGSNLSQLSKESLDAFIMPKSDK